MSRRKRVPAKWASSATYTFHPDGVGMTADDEVLEAEAMVEGIEDLLRAPVITRMDFATAATRGVMLSWWQAELGKRRRARAAAVDARGVA